MLETEFINNIKRFYYGTLVFTKDERFSIPMDGNEFNFTGAILYGDHVYMISNS